MIISYIAIITTILAIVLVSTKIIKERWYSSTIYLVALFNLWSTTLLGQSVVGIDISRELAMSNQALQNGWNWTGIYDVSNTSALVGWAIPQFSKFFQISTEWVYKLFLPMIFACTPAILYIIFRKQLCMPCSASVNNRPLYVVSASTITIQEHHGYLKSFYAAIFFIIMPVFSLEIGAIGKSMVAETLMACCFWTMFSSVKLWIKLPLMILFALLTLWVHYTVGIMLIFYLSTTICILLFVKLFKNWYLWKQKVVSLWIPTIVVMFLVAGFVGYYSKASQGMVYDTVVRLGEQYTVLTNSFIKQPQIIKQPQVVPSDIVPSDSTTITREEIELRELAISARDLDPLTSIGLGKDFIDASILGKIFRVIQYLTQLLVVIGCFWLLFKYKQYNFSREFIAGIGASLLVLLFVVAIPMFSSLINATRNYQLSLFFLAPMFILGIDALTGAKKNV
jgi:uncharacterized membrane protein